MKVNEYFDCMSPLFEFWLVCEKKYMAHKVIDDCG